MNVITKAVFDIETMKLISVESYDYPDTAPVDLCCGPSGAQTSEAAATTSLSNEMAADFGTSFGEQQGVLSQLNKSLSPITAAGPGQQGWTPQESAAINTATLNNSAAAARNATLGVQDSLAGRGGGGSSGLESG